MSQRLSDYFALEAGEYLDQMDVVLAQPGTPDLERLLRLVRGIRGSAHLAQQESIASVADRMGNAVRAVAEGSADWNEDLRARAVRTLDDLRVLVRATRTWGSAEDTRVAAALERWARFEPSSTEAPGGAGEDGGRLFAFVRQELVAILSQLNMVVPELRSGQPPQAPLQEVLKRMRAVRGMAGLDAVGPVGGLLDGMEAAIRELLARQEPASPEQVELLVASRDALVGISGALEQGETPTSATPGVARFHELQGRQSAGAADTTDVVPIRELFEEGPGPHLVSSPVAPAAASGELTPEVKQFLRIESTGLLDRADAALAGAPGGDGRPVDERLAELVSGVREMAAAYGASTLAREADAVLPRLSAGDAAGAIRDLRSALPAALEAGVGTGAEAGVAAEAAVGGERPSDAGVQIPGAAAGGAGSMAAGAEDEAGVVPIESLLLRGEEALREALSLRPVIEQLVPGGGAGEELRGRLRELFELVEQGAEGVHASA